MCKKKSSKAALDNERRMDHRKEIITRIKEAAYSRTTDPGIYGFY